MLISLISVPCFQVQTSYAFPKMGIMALTSWMKKNGYTNDDFDFLDDDALRLSDEELADYLRRVQPEIVGLSAVVAHGYPSVKRMARIVRETCPDTLVIMGGNLSAAANVVLRKTEVDIVVAGDGEYPLVSLLDICKPKLAEGICPWQQDGWFGALSEIKGLSFVDGDDTFVFTGYPAGIPQDEMEFVDLELMKYGMDYREELIERQFAKEDIHFFRPELPSRMLRGTTFSPTKGCVARCTFCQRSTKGMRTAHLDKLENFIVEMKEKEGVEIFSFVGENIGKPKSYLYDVGRLMKKHNVYWKTASTRADALDLEDCKFLREHNCIFLSWGFESGSERILNLMEKKVTPAQQIGYLESILASDIMPGSLNIMLGYPGESDETISETGRLIGEMCYKLGFHPSEMSTSYLNMWFVTPYPGTPLYEYGKSVGAIPSDLDGEEEYIESINSRHKYYRRELNWVNINGSEVKDLLFWEHLLRNEAARRFVELCRKAPPKKTWQGQRFADKHRVTIESTAIRSRILYFVAGHRNPFYNLFPRGLIYPLLKNLLYGLYQFRKLGANKPIQEQRAKPAKASETLNVAGIPMNGNSSSSIRGLVRKRRDRDVPQEVQMLNMLADSQ